MTRRGPLTGKDDRDRPLRLLPPRLVPLSTEQERQAVDALAGLLAGLLARQEAATGGRGDASPAGAVDVPEDDEAA